MQDNIKIWKSIKIGTIKNMDSLLRELEENDILVGDWAKDALNDSSFKLRDKEKNINLFKIAVKDLGFIDGAFKDDIYSKAIKLGLVLCPPKVGPQLRLQYKNQKKLESLQIAMPSITDSVGHSSEFRVVHAVDGRLWLVGDHRHPNNFWEPEEEFIFTKE